MRSPGRSLTRASSIGFGTLFLAVSHACSERAVAPTATDDANEFTISGILSSSLWRVDEGQLTYAGSVSAQGRITQDENGVRQNFEPGLATTAPPPASAQRFSFSPLRAPSTSTLAAAGGARLSWRARLQSPRVDLTTSDGKRVSLQRIADPRGGGRPPVATMLYDGDRPVSLIEGLYQKDGKRWKPTRARITIFGKDGKPSAVTENDFTALQTASVAMPGTAAVLADGFRRVGGTLSKLIQPDALYAASAGDDEERCWRQRLAVAAAALQQVAADVALGIAMTACASSGGLLCPTVLVAMAAVAASAVNYLLKVIDYDECMSRQDPIVGSGGDGTSGGGGSDEHGGCEIIIWEISYDGGSTWEFYDTQWSC